MMDLAEFAKAAARNKGTDKGVSKKQLAAAGAAGGLGVGSATGGIKYGPKMSKKKLMQLAKAGDIVLTGTYTPGYGYSPLKRGDITKAYKEFMKAKGLKKRVKAAGKILWAPANRAFLKAIGTTTGTPYYHGGLVGKGTAHGKRMYHQIGPASADYLSSEISQGRGVLLRPEGVSKKQISKALGAAKSSVRKGEKYSELGSIVKGVGEHVVPAKVRKVCFPAKAGKKSFCTNFVSRSYGKAGVKIAPGVSPEDVLPRHILKSKKLKILGHAGKKLSRAEKLKYVIGPKLLRGVKGAAIGAGAAVGLGAIYKYFSKPKRRAISSSLPKG